MIRGTVQDMSCRAVWEQPFVVPNLLQRTEQTSADL